MLGNLTMANECQGSPFWEQQGWHGNLALGCVQCNGDYKALIKLAKAAERAKKTLSPEAQCA